MFKHLIHICKVRIIIKVKMFLENPLAQIKDFERCKPSKRKM